MNAIEIRREINHFVIHFDTPKHEISAYALASALVSLSDAVREANAIINPGHKVEIVVEAFSPGSFQATVKTIYNHGRNLFSNSAVQAIIWGIVSTHIYETLIKNETPPIITISHDMVIIKSGNEKIIVPRNIYEAKQQVEKSDRFRSAIGKVFEAAASDKDVTGVWFGDSSEPRQPRKTIPVEQFHRLQAQIVSDENEREIIEITNVEINRAILERGRRRWEFFWRGIKIAAPILDERFFDRFFAHEITIAPGDSLDVALRIFQQRHPDSGILINKKYEIVEVYEHTPRLKQSTLK